MINVQIFPVETPVQRNKTLSELGYDASQIKQLELSIVRSIGIISITGPTELDKSTTHENHAGGRSRSAHH